MKLLTLTCQHCGAPLEVPARTTQFKCLYCGSRLHVLWADSVAHAEAIEAAQTSRLIKTPEQFKVEEEIALLDHVWDTIRQRFMVRDNDNQLSVPDRDNIRLTGAFGVLLGVAALVMGAAVVWAPGSPGSGNALVGYLMPLFGVLLIIAIVAWCRHAWKKADDFEVHQHAYQSERQRLLAELEQLPHALAEPTIH
jgi:hypothetical protein